MKWHIIIILAFVLGCVIVRATAEAFEELRDNPDE